MFIDDPLALQNFFIVDIESENIPPMAMHLPLSRNI
jgi:hypothetical protein